MLFHFLYPLHEKLVGFGVFKYITVRAFFALFTAMAVYFIFGKVFVRFLRRKQFWQAIRDDGPIEHLNKGTTPTMGGLLLWAGIFLSVVLWARWDNPFIPLLTAMAFGFGFIGFFDDYKKVILHDAHGLRARYKFPLQVIVGTIGALILFDVLDFNRELYVPFFKTVSPNLGWFYIPFAVFLIVGVSNAVNLTDGLDGLVTMPSVMAFMAYAVFAYIAGHAAIASYLNVPFVQGSGEVAVFCAAIVGSCIGFLWFNGQPAEIFMGDVGSLSLGSVLAMVAIITKHELLLILVGGIFLLETVSVIVQVVSFKLTGKRVFRMAPLHHHFELKGWKESKVIIRFWIVAFILAMLSLSTLKLR